MTPWDGVCGQFHYLHSDGLLIDGKGSIFYMNAEGVPALWCAADRLRRHLHRLWNVTHGGSRGKCFLHCRHGSELVKEVKPVYVVLFFLLLPFMVLSECVKKNK